MDRRTVKVVLVIALALEVVVACSRPRSSPEYERAQTLWTEVVRSRPEAPAADPRADEVLALLERVPANSLDASAAAALRERIEGERRELAEERARREGLRQRAAMPAPPVAAPAPVPAPVAGGGAAGGQGSAPELAPGMKLEDFRRLVGACFDSAGPVQLTGADAAPRAGEMWVMKNEAACRDAHPRLAGQAVLFAGGILEGLSPLGNLKRIEVRQEVELAPLPDGGTGMVVDGGVVPLPPGARLVVPDGGAAR
jgi:hypothetical protein